MYVQDKTCSTSVLQICLYLYGDLLMGKYSLETAKGRVH